MNRKDRRRTKSKKGKTDFVMADPASQQKALLIKQALDAAADLIQYEKLDDAENVYINVLQHAQNNTTAMFNLGIIAHRKLNYSLAEDWFNKVLGLTPHDSEVISALGVLKLDQGDIDGALELSQKALDTHPTAEAHARRAGLFRELGQMDKAINELRLSLELKPDYIGAHYDLSVSKKFSKDDPDLENMIKVEKKVEKQPKKTSIEKRLQLKFALGKALADAKIDDDNAFDKYTIGNELKRSTFQYNAEFLTQYMAQIEKLFTPELIQKFKDCGDPSKKPIFIVGMPRSGTTLIEQIIASHPDVHGAGELESFKNSIPVIQNPDMPEFFRKNEASCHLGLIEALTPELIEQIGQSYISQINKISPDSPYLVDKMPFNFLWVGLISLALPNAKIIHSARNPMDTGLSIYRQLFTQAIPWAYNLEEIGKTYNAYNQLMEFWHKLLPTHIYRAQYENIVTDQENETRRLIKFCGLEWNDACLEFYKAKGQVKTASAFQVRQPMYTDSLKGWKRFETQLQPLFDIVKDNM